jgi:hypothetical protein
MYVCVLNIIYTYTYERKYIKQALYSYIHSLKMSCFVWIHRVAENDLKVDFQSALDAYLWVASTYYPYIKNSDTSPLLSYNELYFKVYDLPLLFSCPNIQVSLALSLHQLVSKYDGDDMWMSTIHKICSVTRADALACGCYQGLPEFFCIGCNKTRMSINNVILNKNLFCDLDCFLDNKNKKK